MSSTSDPALQVNQLPISIEFPEDPERFREVLTTNLRNTASTVNTKEGGLYNLIEQFPSKQYYNINNVNTFRNVYRKVFDLTVLNGGPIGGGATVTFPHGIVGLMFGTLIYAGCTSVTPTYFSVMGQPNIFLSATNINFTNPLGVALTSVIAVCEYLKN
ncbi:MAG TPA: hypothetical protein VIJ14_07965 [Rhabdochlamydiaceae bacterium]